MPEPAGRKRIYSVSRAFMDDLELVGMVACAVAATAMFILVILYGLGVL